MQSRAVSFALLALAAGASAQANADPELDLLVADIADLTVFQRSGAFPSGTNACAFETTVCNAGTVPIPWIRPMFTEHPFIAFLVAREVDGRFEQISDRSWVKHGFFAVNLDYCSPCTFTSEALGVGCSDIYVAGNNLDTNWLGPPDEIDPWLGGWEPFCSYFDRGQPPDPPELCDGYHGTADGGFDFFPLHCIFLRDADLMAPRAPYWFQAMYVIGGESEEKREDSLASRAFTPIWRGSGWDLVAGGPLYHGSVLERWKDAKVSSGTNGSDDGRVHVGVRTSEPDPTDGFTHYEYALHERDNARGVAALRIPLSPGARVRALGFRDIDQDPANDWSAAVVGDELVFSGGSNPLRWNTIFNFWFDCDAAPAPGVLALDQADPGPGADQVRVTSYAPLGARDGARAPARR